MKEIKHTPAPWTWIPGKKSDQGSIEPDICWFGDDTTYYPTEGDPPNDANARLMAAAPDLLNMLEIAVSYAGPTDGWVSDARAAIAKAKGET